MRGACRTKERDNHATSSISTNHDYPTIETNKSKNFVFWQHSEGRKTHLSPLPLNRAHFCFFLFSALPSLPLSRRGGGRKPQVVRSVAGNKEVTHQTKKLSHSAHVCAFSHCGATFCCCCHFLFVSFFFFFLPLFGLDEATGKLKSRHTHTHRQGCSSACFFTLLFPLYQSTHTQRDLRGWVSVSLASVDMRWHSHTNPLAPKYIHTHICAGRGRGREGDEREKGEVEV